MVGVRIRPLLLSPDTAVRTRTLRLLRHLTRRPDQVALLIDSSTDHLVVRHVTRARSPPNPVLSD